MEALLKQLNQLSSDLIAQMESCELEDMEIYMQQRDIIFAKLQSFNPSPDQAAAFRPQVLHIAELDTVITGRMTELRKEATKEIDKINRGKRSKSMYESGSYGADSLFFDTKR